MSFVYTDECENSAAPWFVPCMRFPSRSLRLLSQVPQVPRARSQGTAAQFAPGLRTFYAYMASPEQSPGGSFCTYCEHCACLAQMVSFAWYVPGRPTIVSNLIDARFLTVHCERVAVRSIRLLHFPVVMSLEKSPSALSIPFPSFLATPKVQGDRLHGHAEG